VTALPARPKRKRTRKVLIKRLFLKRGSKPKYSARNIKVMNREKRKGETPTE
jgi:hypothetical protein